MSERNGGKRFTVFGWLFSLLKGLVLVYVSVILVLVLVDVILKYNADGSINVVQAFLSSCKHFNRIGFSFVGKILAGAWKVVSRVAKDFFDVVKNR